LNSYSCLCNTEIWLGKNCDTPNPCLSNPCENGKCTIILPNSYVCNYNQKSSKQPIFMSPEFEDSTFENKTNNLCEINICLNGAHCLIDKIKQGMKCICSQGYTGIFCEKNKVNEKKTTIIPAICDSNFKNESSNISFAMSTSYKENSFYLIQS
jgi:hypothetical protein